MAALLEETAGPLAGQEQGAAFVAGMRLVAIDGMCLDLPDTPENAAEFGYPGNDGGRGPFPQVRVAGLGECGTRAMLGAALSPLATGEQSLARRLLARLSPGDLVAADRNFLSHGLLKAFLDAGMHMLGRAKSDVDLPVLEVLPDGTWLSRIAGPAASRRLRREGADPKDVSGIPVRAIEYTVTSEDGSETRRLSPWSRHPRSRAAISGAGRRPVRLPLAAGNLLRRAGNLTARRRHRGAAVEVPAHDPPGDLRHALLLLSDPHADHRRRGRGGPGPRRISSTHARDAIQRCISDPGCFPPHSLDDLAVGLAFEITCKRNLVPERPGRRDKRETNAQAGGTRPASIASPQG